LDNTTPFSIKGQIPSAPIVKQYLVGGRLCPIVERDCFNTVRYLYWYFYALA